MTIGSDNNVRNKNEERLCFGVTSQHSGAREFALASFE
jgi:hypothetical protein